MTNPKLTAAHYSDQWKAAKFDEVVRSLREFNPFLIGKGESLSHTNLEEAWRKACTLLAEIDRSKP